jgi:hypothetical protein
MIEVVLELGLDSLIVNSVGGSGELAGKMPTRALGFSCKKITSSRQLTDSTPTADFDFLSSAAQRESKLDSDKDFDEQLLKYLTTYTSVDSSRINVASDASGYSTIPKGTSSAEIGRILLAKSPNQRRVDIDLVLKGEEFDAVWELAAGQKIQKVVASLVCFKLKHDDPAPHSETIFVAGIVSSSLQIIFRTGS